MALKRPTGETLAVSVATATGHVFSDLSLLQRALTHSSARGATDDNERLEFLGDRVLGLIVADLLYARFPEARQGELALRLNALVSGETCSAIAHEIGLDGWLRADPVARRATGKVNNALADALEALIAALFLEGGIGVARSFVMRYWSARVDVVVASLRSAKTELQEWLAQRAGSHPTYAILKREGPDHEPVFTVSVEAPGLDPAIGIGRSRQAAEQAAATAMLEREGVRAPAGERN